MTRSQQQLMLLGGLGVVCAAVYVRAFAPARASSSQVSESTVESPAVASVVPASAPSRVTERAYASTLAWGRDPFVRGGGQVSTEFHLSGIIWDEVRPMAMINGTPVGIGEVVDGFRVVNIQQDRVTLTDGATTHQLRIAP